MAYAVLIYATSISSNTYDGSRDISYNIVKYIATRAHRTPKKWVIGHVFVGCIQRYRFVHIYSRLCNRNVVTHTRSVRSCKYKHTHVHLMCCSLFTFCGRLPHNKHIHWCRIEYFISSVAVSTNTVPIKRENSTIAVCTVKRTQSIR